MAFIHQLFTHPVKSMQGIAQRSCEVFLSGLKYDRIFMVTQPDGTFVTARELPQLLQLKTIITDNGIIISLNDQQRIDVNYDDFSSSDEPTVVWHNHFHAHIASINVNRFISEFLNQDVQLRWIGANSDRVVNNHPNIPLTFADAYPFLLINRASFDYLQQQCAQKLTIEQFRGNIIIDGTLPFAEDSWKTIKIGEVIFDIVKPCSRCGMIRVNLDSNQYLPDNEPLKTLQYFRQSEQGEIDFGMNMVARNIGRISVNDPVEVLARHPSKNYIKSFPKPTSIETKRVHFTVNETTFVGNDKQSILEQLEQHGVAMPYSCRSGICGRCHVILEEGEIMPMTQSSIRRNNRILACSCLPKSTHLKLTLRHKRSD